MAEQHVAQLVAEHKSLFFEREIAQQTGVHHHVEMLALGEHVGVVLGALLHEQVVTVTAADRLQTTAVGGVHVGQ